MYLTMVLTCISLILNEVKHLYMYLSFIHVCSIKSPLLSFLMTGFFLIDLWVLLICMWIIILSQSCLLQILALIL